MLGFEIDGTLAASALARAPVSNRLAVTGICVAALVLVYGLFAFAVTAVRNRDHPLAVKYPAYQSARKFSAWEFDPVRLTADAFNRASVRKLQILLFTVLVAGILLMLAFPAVGCLNFQ